MRTFWMPCGAIATVCSIISGAAANQGSARSLFEAGPRLAIEQKAAAKTEVKVFGSIVNAESCSYDPEQKLIVVPNRGVEQHVQVNDAFVTLLNRDGSVHTPFWIGAKRESHTLNHPYGSDIQKGTLYLADLEGGLREGERTSAVIRMFEMKTGVPLGELPVPEVEWFNDIAVASDGSIFATQTRSSDDRQRLYRISPKGEATLLVSGSPLAHPNGVAVDNRGNVVVVNIDDDAVLTFSPNGELLSTERAAQPGNDGIVILSDGTKYVSSVRNGGISKISPGRNAELIAGGIPTPASMCLDTDSLQLVIPMNANNGLAFLPLD